MRSCLILIFFVSAGLAVAARQAAPLHGWQESAPSEPARKPQREFSLAGKFLAAQDIAANPPVLVLKCAPNRPFPEKGKFRVGVVMVGVPLKIHWVEARERKGGLSWYPEVYVSYRLDDGKTVDDEWPPRFDKASVEFEKGEFKKMLRARTVLITMPDKDGRQVSMQFDMPDSGAGPLTSAQVAEACGVSNQKQ